MRARPAAGTIATAAAAMAGLVVVGWIAAGMLVASTASSMGEAAAAATFVSAVAAASVVAGWMGRAIVGSRPTAHVIAAATTSAVMATPGVAMVFGRAALPEVAVVAALGLLAAAPPGSPSPRPVARRWAPATLAAAALIATSTGPASAWLPGIRSTPTAAQQRSHGVDLAISTHQWLASQGMAIVAADGNSSVAAFLASPDPTAPTANDAAIGAPTGSRETYGWRVLLGVRDADGGRLKAQMPDHLHNFWTHRGRQWIVGESAAANAEDAFAEAVGAWNGGDRSSAMYWLGAALHLVQDACVPQHNFFGIGVFHSDYEHWALQHQDQLAVPSGGIYRGDFRATGGHGGASWSSRHPRGWVDECAHRSAAELPGATHPNPAVSSSADPQWVTAPLIADAQRMSAGFIAFFFEEVGGP